MACSSSVHMLVVLSLIYCILSASTFAYLYVFYQNKIATLSDQCFNAIEDKEPTIIDTNIGSIEESTSTLRPPVYREIHEAEDSKCVCPPTKRSVIENGDEGRLNKGDLSESGSGDKKRSQESSFLRCCTANDTTLYENIVKWTKHYQTEPENTSQDSHLLAASLVVGSDDFEIEQASRDSGVIRGWVTRNDRESGYIEGIQLEDESLVVPKDGYYLVYSKVGLRTSSDAHRPLTIGHSTSVGSEDRPEDQNLMHSEKLHSCSESGGTYSSFHSGIFKLFQDDRIYVKVDILVIFE
ncbi:uncharacterized protein [Amphiura filiformis]|uniref:uncharacterized protein n=1 Tax=Amphiura filiformis TaxID=82378 RepID=UPI003B212CF7